MLQFTKRTEYGLIALVHLVDACDVVSVREIAEHYSVPRRLLAEVLKDLSRAELCNSTRGAAGGYSLSRSADSISLGEVVAALEGPPAVSSCETLGAYSHGHCDVMPVCPIRSPLHKIRDGIWRLMQQTSLRSLAHSSADGEELQSPQLNGLTQETHEA